MENEHEFAPAPLVESAVDLTIFRRFEMPVDLLLSEPFVHLRDDPTAWRAQMELVAVSWRGSPAGSLGTSNVMLAAQAGFGSDVEAWLAVADKVLRWWTVCSDGRIYFEPLVPVVEDAWQRVDKKRAGDTGRKRLSRVKAKLRDIGALVDVPEIVARVPEIMAELEQRGYFSTSLRGPDKVALLTRVASDAGMLPDHMPGVTDRRMDFETGRHLSALTGADGRKTAEDSGGQAADSPRRGQYGR